MRRVVIILLLLYTVALSGNLVKEGIFLIEKRANNIVLVDFAKGGLGSEEYYDVLWKWKEMGVETDSIHGIRFQITFEPGFTDTTGQSNLFQCITPTVQANYDSLTSY